MKLTTVLKIITLVAFLIIGPLLLLWTSGYRWDPRLGRLTSTGILVVESDPAGALISIGQEATGRSTPARFTALLQREYAVTMSLPGYHPWRGTVRVEGGKTAFLTGIRLFHDRLPELVLDKPASKLALSPDGGTLAILSEENGLSEIWTTDAGGEETVIRGRPAALGAENLEWSPDGRSLLLVEKTADTKRAVVLGTAEQTVLNAPGRLLDADWNVSDANQILLVTQEANGKITYSLTTPIGGQPTELLRLIATSTGALTPAAILDGGSLIYAAAGATTTQIFTAQTGSGKTKKLLLSLADGPYSFISAPKSYLLLQNARRGKLLLVDREKREAIGEFSAVGAKWFKEAEPLLLFWDELELIALSPPEKPETITRTSEGIRDAAGYGDGSQIIFLTKTALRALPRGDQGLSRPAVDLASFAEAHSLAVTRDQAFVAGTVGNKSGVWLVRLK